MHTNHLVVGAGVAGLTCARELARAGHSVRVIEKARGVGGRCATRRVEGQPVDFGPVFLHGSDPGFEADLRSIPAVTLLEDWPTRRRGAGKPCQHEAFSTTEKRFAIAEGLTAFPKHLAQGIDVRLQTRVTELQWSESTGLRLVTEGGDAWDTMSLVLAVPVEQLLPFVWPLAKQSEEIEAVATLLDMMSSLPCLTLMAGYDRSVPEPDWDVLYPERTEALMLVSHDSSKRREPKQRVLVMQASPGWSRRHLDAKPEDWSATLLAEAAEVVGPWAARPTWTQPHRWRYSRVDLGNELSGPVRIELPGGASIGMAGDMFAPGGGAEAAYCAGRTLARRLLQEDGGHA
jgi:predicted NAD/FAD-dependent oxidoreductase